MLDEKLVAWSLFRDGSDPILIENLDGIVVDMNREAERAYGWSRDELIGEPIQTLVPPDRHDQASKLLHRCRSGDEVRNVEGLRVTKGGEVIPVLLTLSLLKNDDGEPIGISTNAADISALKKVEQQLSELSIKLSKYLSPQIYQSIFSGERDVTIDTARKKLTVFFSDIKDFTATTDDMQPEDLTSLLNHYLTEMSEIALRYGATIDKYIGDAMLLFFGDPETKGVREDARLCVRMALEMQERMRELEKDWHAMGYERPFQMRIGINTGFCNVGNFGSDARMDYTIIGGEVNLAARLEGITDPGGITLSHETFAQVEEMVRAEALEPLTVKGIRREIRPYKVLGGGSDGSDEHRIIRSERMGFRLFAEPDKLTGRSRAKAVAEMKAAIARLEE